MHPSYVHAGYVGAEVDPETGIFFLVPLATSAVKLGVAAAKAAKVAKKARKQVEQQVKQQARAVKAADQAPLPLAADAQAERAKLAQLQSKLATAAETEARARADVIQARAAERVSKIVPGASSTAPADSAGFVVIGNVFHRLPA